MAINPYLKYQQNNILTAPPAQLTLMIYDGAIKFGNLAKIAMENKEIEKAHINISKIQNLITELLNTLDYNYPVAKDFEIVYTNIANLLLKANLSKNPDDMEKVLEELRDIRNIWKELMSQNN